MRNVAFIIIAILVFLFTSSLFSFNVLGDDKHVDKDNAIIYQDGTEGFPFESIQSAIDHFDTASGDILLVHEATTPYDESVNVDISVTITRYQTDNVEVFNDGTEIFAIAASGVIIEHITITGDGTTPNAILVSDNDAIIRNCMIDSVETGIYLEAASFSNIHDNTFSNTDYIIDFLAFQDQHLDHLIADTNTLEGKPIKYYRDLSGEMISFPDDNISFLGFYHCEEISIQDTIVNRNAIGLLLAGCSDVIVTGSEFSDHKRRGILAFECTGIDLKDTTIANTPDSGISFHSSEDMSITHCDIINNSKSMAERAVYIVDSSNVIILENKFSREFKGIQTLLDSDTIVVEGNDFADVEYAVYSDHAENVSIRGNRFEDFRTAFFTNDDMSDTRIVGNIFKGSGDESFGIYIGSTGSTSMIVENNDFNNCEIGIESRSLIHLEDNKISDSSTGLLFSDSNTTGSVVRAVSFLGCDKAIIVYESEILVEECTFTSNDLDIELNGKAGKHYISTARSTQLDSGKLHIDGNYSLFEQYPLIVLVQDSNLMSLNDAELFVRNVDKEENEDTIFYATPGYKGIDEPTSTDGKIGPLYIIYRKHEETGYQEFACWINASKEGVEGMTEVTMDVEKSISIILDIIAPENKNPTVAITYPDNNDLVMGVITFRGEAAAPDGDSTLEKVELRIEGGIWLTVSGTTSWEFQYDTTQEEDGKYFAEARSFDGEDYSLIDGIFVEVINVENNAPEIQLISPTNGTIFETNSFQFVWMASDKDGDGLTYDLYLGMHPNSTNLIAADLTVATYLFSNLGFGTIYYWMVLVSDGTDEVNSGMRSFTVEVNQAEDDDDKNWYKEPNYQGGIAIFVIVIVIIGVFLIQGKREEYYNYEWGGEEEYEEEW